jgi:hypothetical protein
VKERYAPIHAAHSFNTESLPGTDDRASLPQPSLPGRFRYGRTLQSIDGNLKPDREWRMEVMDEFQNPLYVLHINAEKPK